MIDSINSIENEKENERRENISSTSNAFFRREHFTKTIIWSANRSRLIWIICCIFRHEQKIPDDHILSATRLSGGIHLNSLCCRRTVITHLSQVCGTDRILGRWNACPSRLLVFQWCSSCRCHSSGYLLIEINIAYSFSLSPPLLPFYLLCLCFMNQRNFLFSPFLFWSLDVFVPMCVFNKDDE